jgi:AhpD family alkylhydroperoxidase
MTATQTLVRTASIDIKKFLPGLYPAVNALSDAVEPAGLEAELIELVNLRASQINGCAYCVQYHTSNLREMGVADAKITLAVAWQEAGIFSEREQAAFAWTEAITLIAHDHVPDTAYKAARTVFSEPELVGLTAAIAAINVWNRFGVAFRYAPEV